MYNGREQTTREERGPYKGASVAISGMLWHSVKFAFKYFSFWR